MNRALYFPLIRLIRLIGPIRPIGLIFPKVVCFLGMVFPRPHFFDKKFHLRRILAHITTTFAA